MKMLIHKLQHLKLVLKFMHKKVDLHDEKWHAMK